MTEKNNQLDVKSKRLNRCILPFKKFEAIILSLRVHYNNEIIKAGIDLNDKDRVVKFLRLEKEGTVLENTFLNLLIYAMVRDDNKRGIILYNWFFWTNFGQGNAYIPHRKYTKSNVQYELLTIEDIYNFLASWSGDSNQKS
jgi:hypothetical protein